MHKNGPGYERVIAKLRRLELEQRQLRYTIRNAEGIENRVRACGTAPPAGWGMRAPASAAQSRRARNAREIERMHVALAYCRNRSRAARKVPYRETQRIYAYVIRLAGRVDVMQFRRWFEWCASEAHQPPVTEWQKTFLRNERLEREARKEATKAQQTRTQTSQTKESTHA
jgi:hypothetical protein